MALSAAMIAADATPAIANVRAPGRAARTAGSPSTTILFQGDSITDCSRDRAVAGANDPRGLGTGYPYLLAGALRERHPGSNLQILNRGVSGNTVDDLVARWDRDTLQIRPDVLSILIGVNDIWHTLTGSYSGTPEKYAAGYHDLMERTRKALPDVKLVILEPFVLRTGAVSDAWFPAFDKFRAGARSVAKSAGATFVPLHDMFQELARTASPAYWAADGVHPTIAGHEAIARRWQDAVKL